MRIQKEYLEYSHSFDRGELSEEQTLELGSMLFNTNLPFDGKKRVLGLLAHLETILAYRQIEKYVNTPDNDELKQWAVMALQECRMFLESELLEENTGILLSGLGGKGDRMRYYCMVFPFDDNTFSKKQMKMVLDEFHIVCKDHRSVVEASNSAENYIGMTLLIPLDVAVGTVIESGINKCNEMGEFVFEHYYVTNQNIPDESEIDEIIRIVKEDDKK